MSQIAAAIQKDLEELRSIDPSVSEWFCAYCGSGWKNDERENCYVCGAPQQSARVQAAPGIVHGICRTSEVRGIAALRLRAEARLSCLRRLFGDGLGRGQEV